MDTRVEWKATLINAAGESYGRPEGLRPFRFDWPDRFIRVAERAPQNDDFTGLAYKFLTYELIELRTEPERAVVYREVTNA